jgi:hypothetical protein
MGAAPVAMSLPGGIAIILAVIVVSAATLVLLWAVVQRVSRRTRGGVGAREPQPPGAVGRLRPRGGAGQRRRPRKSRPYDPRA